MAAELGNHRTLEAGIGCLKINTPLPIPDGDWEYVLFYGDGPDPDEPDTLVMRLAEFPDPLDRFLPEGDTEP